MTLTIAIATDCTVQIYFNNKRRHKACHLDSMQFEYVFITVTSTQVDPRTFTAVSTTLHLLGNKYLF